MHESSHSQHGESDEKSSTETEEDAVSLADIPDLNNYHDVFQPRDRERQSPLPFRVQPLGFYRFFYRISHEFLPFFFGCGFHQLSPVSFFSSAAIFFGREGGGSFSNRISVRLCCFLWLWPAFNGSWLRFSPVPDSASILSLFSLCYRKRTRIKLGPRKKNHSVQVERHGKATFNLFEPCFQFRKPSKTR